MTIASFSLQGKLALVTGSAGGLGAGIAEALAKAGAQVIVSDINAEGASLKADWIQMDVSQEASVAAACKKVVRRHGTPWALVNNAGIQDRQLICKETVEAWDRIQAVNARGSFLVTREFGSVMAGAGRGGCIVNVASAVLAGMIVKGTAAYTASKGALAAFSSISALEFVESGITVNTVLPGAAMTPGTIGAQGPTPEGPGTRPAPFGFCEPRDIGAAVHFLVSEEARFVTNQTLAVDAGFSLS